LKIAINAASAKMGGAVNYLTSLLRYLPPPESWNQFFVFLPSDTARTLQAVPENIRLCPLPDRNIGGWRRVWWEQVTLRRFLVREKVDVLFSTANFAMFRCPVRQLLLLRNALYFSKIYREMFLPKHSLRTWVTFRLRRWLVCRSARSADVVMTPTQTMLDELREYIEVAPGKALVNPYGVTESFEPAGKDASGSVSRQEGSPVRLLYVSLYAEHKNLTTLLKALPLLNRNGGRKFLLETTVNPAWEGARWTLSYQDDLSLARRQDIAPWARFVGPLGRHEARALYRSADIFVFPSLTESFGHPLAEAMVHGLPIVASDTPVNREICGHAAVYFSPLSPEDLAAQLTDLVLDGALRKRLSAQGLHRAHRHFRWMTHVDRILTVLQTPASRAQQCQPALTQARCE
jgi:glycosyltransferase involved in cell wall biosynthesis